MRETAILTEDTRAADNQVAFILYISHTAGKENKVSYVHEKRMFWRVLEHWKCEEARIYCLPKQTSFGQGWRTDTGRSSCTLKELINNWGKRISPIEVSKVLGIYKTISEAVIRQWGLQFWTRPSGKIRSPRSCCSSERWSILRNRAQRWTRMKIGILKAPRKNWFVVDISESGTGKSRRMAIAVKIW